MPEMANILNIGGESIFDDRIVETYNPYTNTMFRHSNKNIYTTAKFIHVTM